MSPRRQQILDIAADLFAQRGFHGVSVADLGAACGVSGPALYKHFPSKDAVLAEMLVSISEELLSVGRRRVEAAATPADAVEALIEWHIEFALAGREGGQAPPLSPPSDPGRGSVASSPATVREPPANPSALAGQSGLGQ